MPDYSAIARGALQRASVPNLPAGGGGGVNWASGGGGMTVAPANVANYSGWTMGAPATGQAVSLPRPILDFLGMLGPLPPQIPQPLDIGDPDSGRPDPRQFQYPTGWNIPIGLPGSEGLKLAPFAQLRYLAQAYSVIRTAIDVRKQEMLGLDWDIAPTKLAEKQLQGDQKARNDWEQRKAQIVAFFEFPDREQDFQSWWAGALEDHFCIDAVAIHLQSPRRKGMGRGVLGSELAALNMVDGTTIRPMLDIRGRAPRPPAPAWQQYLYGVPRVDMMDIIMQSDLDEMDEPADRYRNDQMMYKVYNSSLWTPYGFPGIEKGLVPVTTGLRKQMYALEYFVEGSIPGAYVIPGAASGIDSPGKALQLQNTLNAMAGDTAWKHRIIVLPPGSTTAPQKPVALADQFDEINISMCLMAYDVMPMEVGISPRVSSTQCYAEGTEVLTRDGWKSFAEVRHGLDGDEFATRNPKTHEFEWQHATGSYEGDWDGEMVDFTNRDFTLKVTPNHRMVICWQNSKNRPSNAGQKGECFRDAEVIHRKVTLPAVSEWKGKSPETVRFGAYEWSSSDFAAFLGFWIAEGCLGRQVNKLRGNSVQKQIRITQLRGTKGFEPVTELLTRMLGHTPCYHEQSRSYLFNCAELWHYLGRLGHAHTKYIPEEVKNWSAEDLAVLVHYYLLGDGWQEGPGGRWRAKTVSERLANDMQEIGQKIGQSVSITRQEPRDVSINGRDISAVNCRRVYLLGFRQGKNRAVAPSRSRYVGKVRCVSVPNETLFVRTASDFDRPLTAVWCGNSPGAANQMAKQNEAVSKRKAMRPCLKWWKTAIFDLIIRRVLHQDDMQWWWPDLEEGEDEDTLVHRLMTEIGSAQLSIDEARVQRGSSPWGLPITSGPVWATGNGIVPLEVGVAAPALVEPPKPATDDGGAVIAADSADSTPTNVDPLIQGDKPTGNTQEPPQPENQPDVSHTPAHDAADAVEGEADEAVVMETASKVSTRAQSDELRAMRRRLDKGGTLADWQPRSIPWPIFKAMLTCDDPIETGKTLLRKARRVDKRDRFLDQSQGRTHDKLKALGKAGFVNAAVGVLHGAYSDAATQGAKDSAAEFDVPPMPDDAIDQMVAQRAETQRPFLAGFLAAWASMSDAQHDARLGSYAASQTAAYEQAYVQTVTATSPSSMIIWHTTSEKPCDPCDERDGEEYTEASLPGWPGDGGYAGEDPSSICDGAGACRCWLELVQGDETTAETAPGGGPVEASATPAVTKKGTSLGFVTADEARAASRRRAGTLIKPVVPVTVAGLLVKADDTGRVLMLQRAIDPDDPASGRWEIPGGHLEAGEQPLEAARREWSEEVGSSVPDGVICGDWTSATGIYQAFILVVPGEAEVPVNLPADERIANPDGDVFETAAWWDPLQLPGNPGLRDECQASDWRQIRDAHL